MKIPLHQILPNPNQPRSQFDQDKLEELAQSIREHGVLQPIVVEMRAPEDYIIHYGERRWRAAGLAGLDDIPAIVVDTVEADEAGYLARAMIENVQRQDLSPLEVAEGYQRLHDLGWSDKKIAESVGKSRPTVANARRLLTLPPEIREPLANGEISERQAQALLPLYQLPAPAQAKVNDSSWRRPAHILKKAKEGVNSNLLRDDVKWAIREATTDLDFPFQGHSFEGDGFQSPVCEDCPVLFRLGQEQRCGDKGCAGRKEQAWQTLSLEQASAASGVPILHLTGDDSWYDYSRLIDEGAGCQILQQGCDKLRLEYQRWSSADPVIADFPNIQLGCHHGRGNKCTCLAAFRREQAKTEPAALAEKEGKRRLEQEVIAPAVQAIARGLETGEPGAFRLLLRRVTHVHPDKCKDWTPEQILNKLARTLIETDLSWRSFEDVPGARETVKTRLAEAGLAFPPLNPVTGQLDRIEHKLARIAGWLANESEPDPAAIKGNLANLNTLIDELSPLTEIEDEEAAALAEGLLKQAAELMELLAPA